MGCYNKYGTIAVGAYGAHWPGRHPPSFTDQYFPKWDRGGASAPRTWKDKLRWNSLWSYGCRVGGGDAEGYAPTGNGQGLAGCDLFEPYSCDGEGTQSVNFILGTCVDASDVAVANPIVQGFRTSDDAYLGEVQARTDGTYTLGMQVALGTACYLVAYKPGSPDIAGTTTNTLTPTNVVGG